MFQPCSVPLSLLLLSMFLLTGCQTLGTFPSNNSQTSKTGGGNGKTLMTIAGTIGGTFPGGELLGGGGSGTSTQSQPGAQLEVTRTQTHSTLNN